MKTLRWTFALALMALMAPGLRAADESQWMTDFSKAQALAKKENKKLLLDFTGSDWCPPCKALHANVLGTEVFQKYAKENLILVELDFPRRKPQSAELIKQNKELSQRFSVRGYPTIILLDGEGKKLGEEVGYSGAEAAAFIAQLKSWESK